MRYNLTYSTNITKAKKRLDELIVKGSNIELKEVRPKKTLKQNKYLHVILSAFAMEFGYTLKEVKEYIYKSIVNEEIFVYYKHNVKCLRSITELDTQEISITIERFRNYSSENGLYLPTPEEKSLLNDIENNYYKYENQIYL